MRRRRLRRRGGLARGALQGQAKNAALETWQRNASMMRRMRCEEARERSEYITMQASGRPRLGGCCELLWRLPSACASTTLE